LTLTLCVFSVQTSSLWLSSTKSLSSLCYNAAIDKPETDLLRIWLCLVVFVLCLFALSLSVTSLWNQREILSRECEEV
jgi:hypothetical protein